MIYINKIKTKWNLVNKSKVNELLLYLNNFLFFEMNNVKYMVLILFKKIIVANYPVFF